MLRKLGKGIGVLLGIIAVLFTILFIALSFFNSPVYAWRLLRYGQSDIGDVRVFPERAIANAEDVSLIPRGDQGTPYEVNYPYKNEMRTEVLDELLKRKP